MSKPRASLGGLVVALRFALVSAFVGSLVPAGHAQQPSGEGRDALIRSEQLYRQGMAAGDVAMLVEAARLRDLAANTSGLPPSATSDEWMRYLTQPGPDSQPISLMSADDILEVARSAAGNDPARVTALDRFQQRIVRYMPGEELVRSWQIDKRMQISYAIRSERRGDMSVRVSSEMREGKFVVEVRARDGRLMCGNPVPEPDVWFNCSVDANSVFDVRISNVSDWKAQMRLTLR